MFYIDQQIILWDKRTYLCHSGPYFHAWNNRKMAGMQMPEYILCMRHLSNSNNENQYIVGVTRQDLHYGRRNICLFA